MGYSWARQAEDPTGISPRMKAQRSLTQVWSRRESVRPRGQLPDLLGEDLGQKRVGPAGAASILVRNVCVFQSFAFWLVAKVIAGPLKDLSWWRSL